MTNPFVRHDGERGPRFMTGATVENAVPLPNQRTQGREAARLERGKLALLGPCHGPMFPVRRLVITQVGSSKESRKV